MKKNSILYGASVGFLAILVFFNLETSIINFVRTAISNAYLIQAILALVGALIGLATICLSIIINKTENADVSKNAAFVLLIGIIIYIALRVASELYITIEYLNSINDVLSRDQSADIMNVFNTNKTVKIINLVFSFISYLVLFVLSFITIKSIKNKTEE